MIKLFRPSPIKRFLFFLIGDVVLSLLSLFLAYQLRFNFYIPTEHFANFWKIFIVLLSIKLFFLVFFKTQQVAWRFFSLNDAKRVLYAHLLSYGVFLCIFYIFHDSLIPFARSIVVIDFALSFIMIGSFRFLKRFIVENSSDISLKKTIVIGANSFTQTLLRENNSFYVVDILDDDVKLVGSYFGNYRIKSFKELEKVLKSENGFIETVIITKKLDRKRYNKIYEIARRYDIYDIRKFSIKSNSITSISVEDLLARHPKDLDKSAIESFIKNKTIMITGAGGSIGSELCRQCEKFGAKKLIMIDHSEYNLYQITEEIKDVERVSVLESVVHKRFLEKTFKTYKPDIVIHAAAYKHVPLCEENIQEAILNNIIGTKNMIDLSIKYGIKKFVLISTDKAVRPTNVMGTTKRVCELYAQNVKSGDMVISAVRFGNVLGSSGSVIPKFQKQIEQGGPITVTHPEITRYFMLIPEACQLVLQAGSLGSASEIFILDMGEPVKIVELAKKMIALSGKDIKIEFTGLRAGEKLYEELLIDESEKQTKYDSIMIGRKTDYDIELLNLQIEKLLTSTNPLEILKEIVPEFEHNKV